jgi:NhaA family Na+:H+ antiporter
MNKMRLHFIRDFIKTESAGGIITIVAAFLALIVANSPLSLWYESLLTMPLTFNYSGISLNPSFAVIVQDVLMVLFFLMVGMELKHEMCEGAFVDRKQIIAPLLAAVGGMFVPALIFYTVNHHHQLNLTGWAIPSATDIAFALCILKLLGRRVPSSAKAFLLAIAIFDDIGAILIIALFYSATPTLVSLAFVLLGMALLFVLNRLNISTITPYILVGVFLCFVLHHAGIHTTIGGVIVGVAIPMRHKHNHHHTFSPLNRCMKALHPYVSFLILPLFAFTSAGVSLDGIKFTDIFEPLPLGIMLGLFVGKQIGIFGTTWALIKMRIFKKIEGVSWVQLYGISIIAGVGFTMSIFINKLAFADLKMQILATIGIMCGSILSALWGFVVLRYLSKVQA